MANFFFKYSDYAAFEKALKDCEGEDIIVDILSNDDSLTETENISNKHIIRKDNRFNQESSFNKFFGPRKSKNVDLKDFSSWKNKNYRETEKQIGQSENSKNKFSFSDFMAERSGGKIYNDEDQNRSDNQQAIHELSSDNPTFKKFSLNDYMRRLEEQTRVKESTRENEDLIDSIGDMTQLVEPDSMQDESFNENVSNVKIENIVGDEEFAGEKFAVDTDELEQMQERLKKLKEETDKINQIIDEPQIDEDTIDFDETEFEKNYQQNYQNDDDVEDKQDDSETDGLKVDETDGFNEEQNKDPESNNEAIDEDEVENPVVSEQSDDSDDINIQIDEDDKKDDLNEAIGVQSDTQTAIQGNQSEINDNDDVLPIKVVQIINTGNDNESKSQSNNNSQNNEINDNDESTHEDFDKTKEIIRLIAKNEEERKVIEEKLRQAEADKNETKVSYENRLREIEQSIEEKDKETKQHILQEKIKNDNKITLVQAEFKQREQEIRKLEKEAAQKLKIGELLKKELKNNLNISNLEMNNKLLEISSSMAREKEKAKANRPKTTRKRKTRRRLDSDIIGSVDFD